MLIFALKINIKNSLIVARFEVKLTIYCKNKQNIGREYEICINKKLRNMHKNIFKYTTRQR